MIKYGLMSCTKYDKVFTGLKEVGTLMLGDPAELRNRIKIKQA